MGVDLIIWIMYIARGMRYVHCRRVCVYVFVTLFVWVGGCVGGIMHALDGDGTVWCVCVCVRLT